MNALALGILNTIFPTWCQGCGQKLEQRERWLCKDCRDNLRFNTQVVTNTDENDWSDAAAVFAFTPAVRRLIHMLKYEETTRTAQFLGEQAARYLLETQPFDTPDFIAPVPLHKTRKRERGYNQSLLLSWEIAQRTGIALAADLVSRRRYTQTQTHLGRDERRENVANAFLRNPNIDVSGRKIMVVDDVFTTGATASAVAKALLADDDVGYGAAKQVFVLTIARA